jgi:DNA-binding MurR/RpiR family transcriptional regulator
MANFNNPLDQMQSYYDDLTKTDKDIAVFILNNPQIAATEPTEQLIKHIKVSKSALSRFAKKIGYTGFIEFRYSLSRFLVSENASAGQEGTEGNALQTITSTYASYLQTMAETCDINEIHHIAKLVAHAKKIKIFGLNRTYNSALQMKQRLGRMGIDAEAVFDSVSMEDASSMVKKDDLAIIYTIRNKISYGKYVKVIKDNGCPVVCITMNQDIPFRKLCDAFVVLPRISRDAKMSFLDDQPLFQIYSEVLLAEVAKLL